MIVYIYNINVDLYNGFNGLRHRINWTYFSVLDGLAHPLYSSDVLVRIVVSLSFTPIQSLYIEYLYLQIINVSVKSKLFHIFKRTKYFTFF